MCLTTTLIFIVSLCPSFFLVWPILSDGSINVQSSMFDRSKPKIGCLSLIANRWTHLNSFKVRKNDVRVSSISNLVDLVKALLGLKFDHLKPKIRCSSSITNWWTCSSLFDVQKMMFDPTLTILVLTRCVHVLVYDINSSSGYRNWYLTWWTGFNIQ